MVVGPPPPAPAKMSDLPSGDPRWIGLRASIVGVLPASFYVIAGHLLENLDFTENALNLETLNALFSTLSSFGDNIPTLGRPC